jgi:hypothetical protein
MGKKPFQLRVLADGSASNAYVYGDKVPVGKVAIIESLAASVWTSAYGDYDTQKFIFLGFQHEGQDCLVEGEDINATNTMRATVSIKTPIILNEGDRVLAYIEATSASQTYLLVATGWLVDVGDL